MRLDTLPMVFLLLGAAIAAPPGSKDRKTSIPAKGGGPGSDPESAPGGLSIGGDLAMSPAAAGSRKSAGSKQIKLGDIFDVLDDESKDSCAQYYDPKAEPGKSEKRLNQYWDQVYTFITSANAAIGTRYKSDAEKQKLMQLYFGIKASEKDVPSKGIESQAFEKVQDWHQQVMTYITTPQQGERKPRLTCGSKHLLFQESFKPMKDADGNDVRPNLYYWLQDNGKSWNDLWVFWDALDKSYHIQERTEQEKEHWGVDPEATPFWEDEDKQVHMCMHPEVDAATNSAAGEPLRSGASDWEKRTHRKRATVILCPTSFEAMEHATPPIMKQELDTGAHAVGSELATMGTNALLLYHELFHLVFEKQYIVGVPQVTQDIPTFSAHVGEDQKIPADFPSKKSAWEFGDTNTLGPIQCGYLALYDRAKPRAAELMDYLSIRNPESYAWFGLTSALHDKDNMDWSSGVAQKAGGAFKGVYTSKDDYREDKFVPINTCPAAPQDADSDWSS